ncbi:MAG: hypothetical protein KDA36_10765, partial [Planctomycetaceae bacterium]|nr:hypothetical protein [Planctomycetaceae bacterium]
AECLADAGCDSEGDFGAGRGGPVRILNDAQVKRFHHSLMRVFFQKFNTPEQAQPSDAVLNHVFHAPLMHGVPEEFGYREQAQPGHETLISKAN